MFGTERDDALANEALTQGAHWRASMKSPYAAALEKRAPELDGDHMLTLAYDRARTLNSKPPQFFDEIAALARNLGPERLAAFHARLTERL